ncbi:MFS transporter [Acinetobacter gerneri]|uniref:MFS transporter n=1 Tax=Acinetobacter gerneri TaxID=202952 RepID=UPI00293579DA|nr:MFS transporter [Acinetobacter gerneri]MDV2441695.1 MFS transporter [Acinetobacter gerneri]
MPKIFNSLHYPNFRRYFIGHTLSTLGTWIQQVALAWLVYEMTNSATLLGLIAFFAMAPQLVISPFVGALIDKINKRSALIIVQFLFFSQSALLAFLTYFDLLNSISIIILSLILGIFTAIDTPLRQSFISDLVDEKQNIGNALALNAMIFNLCRFIGPPIAGFLLAFSSAFICFLLNALSYLFLIIALFLMKNIKVSKAAGNIQNVLKEGYIFVFKNKEYAKMMLNVAIINLTASSYVAILPIFARDQLHGDEKTLGYLWGMAGIGSLLSSLILANTQNFDRIRQRIFFNMMICAAALFILGLLHLDFAYYLAMLCLGFGISTSNVSTNILIQRNTPSTFRGRVVSIYTSLRFGCDALGGLFAGILATYIGAKYTMLSFACILSCYLFLIAMLNFSSKKSINPTSL